MAASRVLLLGPETLLSDLDSAFRALLLSQAGSGGSVVLTTLTTREEFTMPDEVARCVLLRRLRLPLPLSSRLCRCGGELDGLGDHRAACATARSWSGALAQRAAARVCYEAGARVATNVALRDLNLGVPVSDGRRLEVVANGLPAFGGIQVAVDVTLVSSRRREVTERKRRATYPEFQGARRCRLIVFAAEVGSRCGEEAEAFLQKLAGGRVLASSAAQRGAVAAAYVRRWGQILAIAAQTASFASSFCELPIDSALAVYASAPPEGDVLSDARRAPGA